MKLDEHEALRRLDAADHGVLCTMHARRGADAVPVAFAVDADRTIGIPVDTVKPKASLRLQREKNLIADPRATLLVEQWDPDDWSQLWWVRVGLRHGAEAVDRPGDLADRLVAKYPQYHDRPFARILVLRIVEITGWAASPD